MISTGEAHLTLVDVRTILEERGLEREAMHSHLPQPNPPFPVEAAVLNYIGESRSAALSEETALRLRDRLKEMGLKKGEQQLVLDQLPSNAPEACATLLSDVGDEEFDRLAQAVHQEVNGGKAE